MGLTIGSGGSAFGLGAVAPGQAVASAPRPDNSAASNSTDGAGGPSQTGASNGNGQASPPLTGIGKPLLAPGSARQAQEQGTQGQGSTSNPGGPKAADGSDLTPAQQEEVAKLKQVDRAVKAHEQAHASVGGQYAGAPHYSYAQGPDGQRYAVGGEVSISAGGISGDPAATIRKEEQVIAAALAPADPSGQDRAVAASAQAVKAQAEAELSKKQQEQLGKASAGQGPSPQSGTPGSQAGASGSGVGGKSPAVPGVAAYQQAINRASAPSAISLSA